MILRVVLIFILIGVINAELSLAQIHRERDPFSLPAGIHPLSKGETATMTREEKSKAGRVKAILISRHIRLALVDRSIVTIGDSVNDEKVVEIRPDQVILKKEGKKRAFFLHQSAIPLKVEEN